MKAAVHQQLKELIAEKNLVLFDLDELLKRSYTAQTTLLYYQLVFSDKIEHALQGKYALVGCVESGKRLEFIE